jgi:hypothetical protein
MPEIDTRDEVIPHGDVYLDDFLAPEGISQLWDEMRVGRANITAAVDPVALDASYRLTIQCCLAAPAVDGRPTSVRTVLFLKWNPIDNIIVPDRCHLYRAQDQTIRCRHVHGSPDLHMPVVLAGEDIWVPLSEFLACVFRNPPEIL